MAWSDNILTFTVTGLLQALVHVSNKMSRGRYHELKGLVSFEVSFLLIFWCSSQRHRDENYDWIVSDGGVRGEEVRFSHRRSEEAALRQHGWHHICASRRRLCGLWPVRWAVTVDLRRFKVLFPSFMEKKAFRPLKLPCLHSF